MYEKLEIYWWSGIAKKEIYYVTESYRHRDYELKKGKFLFEKM
jgi:hypothetical protein